MRERKSRIEHAEIVRRFAIRLRELRHSSGLTQKELATQARVTISYMVRLEGGAVAPGIDLVGRLAEALGVTVAELLPTEAPTDTLGVLQRQGQKLFESLLKTADRETWQLVNPLLARMVETSNRR